MAGPDNAPPQALEAERAVIGSMLLDAQAEELARLQAEIRHLLARAKHA